MRYLGNKESILDEIKDLLEQKQLLKKNYIFFDAFCGTGSVVDSLKSYYDKIIINDNLKWAVTYTSGRLNSFKCSFKQLEFDPFEYLNQSCNIVQGFFYENYAPTKSERMYFTPYNAGKIDFFRNQIEIWRKKALIKDYEYDYLLASLIESISSVSNTAGVYGAFLKKWDSRALKEINFIPIKTNTSSYNSLKSYNDKIENIIEKVECDILYLDPPYTQNQYGTQYHLLETLVLNDNPTISKITGSRSTTPMRSDWSKDYKVHILFDYILAKTKAKYIVLSYSSSGLMSKEYIEASLKRYGKIESYTCKKIEYKKYQNWKSKNNDQHFEYLFFIEKKDPQNIIYESPLNYIGSKIKVLPDILKYQPSYYETFIDAFGGGFNVGANIRSDKIIYNDLNFLVSNLIQSFKGYDTYNYILYVKKIIKKFELEKRNKENYLKLREYYNSQKLEKRDPRMLFTLILYGFQQQIRFNSQYNFNNPAGIRWFNEKILEKVVSFSRNIKEKNIEFYKINYHELQIPTSTFIYLDPPYSLTLGSYNDGKRGFEGWNKTLEANLFDYIDELTKNKIPMMLSYVSEHKGNKNYELLNWVKEKKYNIIELGEILGISGSQRKEILIINYDL